MTTITRRRLAQFAGAALTTPAIAHAAGPTEISFYFPVAVGGPIAKIIDGYAADFQGENPTIKLTPVYSGTYQDTLTKTQTALKAGTGPQLALLLSTDVFSLIDDDLIVPFDDVATSEADQAWMRSFYPAFLKNGEVNGHTWGIPFQRSTIVLYWNKAAFQEAGLNPDHAPATWTEHGAYAQKLTKRKGDGVERWGVQIPATGFAYWLFQALVDRGRRNACHRRWQENRFRQSCMQSRLSTTGLTCPANFVRILLVSWTGATTPRDFLEQKVAMIWTTTGNLSNIRANAKFPFGVSMLPAGKRRGSPTGGGNLYLFKSATPDQRAAALHFVRWLSSPERAARWGINTGYIATRPDAWATSAMKNYVADFPAAAVARDQLQFAVAELSTHDNQRVTQGLNDAPAIGVAR